VPEGKNFTDFINPNSLKVIDGLAEPCVEKAKPFDRFQFERLGYFCVDAGCKEGKPVFNRTATLRDEWTKIKQFAK